MERLQRINEPNAGRKPLPRFQWLLEVAVLFLFSFSACVRQGCEVEGAGAVTGRMVERQSVSER